MNEITAITPQIKDKRRCNIFVDGRFCCGMSLETTVKNRLKVGQTVSPEALAKMQLESEKSVALDKALTHISATRKTEKQVRDFLRGKGYLKDVIDYVLEKMQEYGFVDDGEYAETYVEFAGTKKGGRLIKMELRKKGIAQERIDEALGGLSEETQLETASAILQKYIRNKERTRETLQKAYRYLISKGFHYETAKSAIAALGEDVDEE